MNTATIVQKLWNYCNVLRNDGMSYGDYVEQLTYLLFLKMADERTKAPYNQNSLMPETYSWPSLITKDSDELSPYTSELEAQATTTLNALNTPPVYSTARIFWQTGNCKRTRLNFI